MWIRPSIPSRSTNAPKSTMLEITPSTSTPGDSRSRICWRCSLRSSSSTARRDRTTLLRLRLSSITLQRSVWSRYSSRSCTRRMSTSDAGRNPRTPRSMMRPPLTTSMTVPSTGSPLSAAASIRFQAFSNRARFLDRIRRPSASSFCSTSASIVSPTAHLLVGVHRTADGELGDRDHALRLVSDVDQDLVLVDADDGAGDDVALAEAGQRAVVVGDEHAVHLDHPGVERRRRSAVSVEGICKVRCRCRESTRRMQQRTPVDESRRPLYRARSPPAPPQPGNALQELMRRCPRRDRAPSRRQRTLPAAPIATLHRRRARVHRHLAVLVVRVQAPPARSARPGGGAQRVR